MKYPLLTGLLVVGVVNWLWAASIASWARDWWQGAPVEAGMTAPLPACYGINDTLRWTGTAWKCVEAMSEDTPVAEPADSISAIYMHKNQCFIHKQGSDARVVDARWCTMAPATDKGGTP